jgi:capsular polysaccharide biosynthesis protein
MGPNPQPRRRLYISRSDAVDRRVVNEDEVLGAIADLGFERVTLSGLSVAAQIRLFQTADIVLAPHGAGTANILFAPADCLVTELMGPAHVATCFMILASTLGQLYGYVGCTQRGRDLAVDPRAVRRVLDDLLRTRAAQALL